MFIKYSFFMYCSFVGEQDSTVRKEGNTSIFSDDEEDYGPVVP